VRRMPHAALLCGAAALLGLASAPAAAQSDSFDCLIEAQSRVKVSASAPGVIARMNVDRGDLVKQGDVLAELESSVETAQFAAAQARAQNIQGVESARARLMLARSVDDRLNRLRRANAGAVTEASLDEARSELASALAGVRDAESNLELARLEAARAAAVLALRRVVSPVDGVVVERALTVGEYRHEQAHVLTVARIDPLHVEVFAPLRLLNSVRGGDMAEVTPEEPVGGRHMARVQVVDRLLDAASGTFGMRLVLPNPGLAIPAGLRCKVRFLPRN
jgi:RND family efflux transporter MFP subunit